MSLNMISCSYNNSSDKYTKEQFIMDTNITQTVFAKNGEQVIENVFDKLIEIENMISLYKEDSDINYINLNSGIKPVKVNNYTYELIKISKYYSEISNGTFDISIAPITKLWSITGENPVVPTKEEIDMKLDLVGYGNIILNDKEKTVFLSKKGMEIDLGGVAKGYIANVIIDEYKKNNIVSGLISIGGNVITYKDKPDKKQYNIGLRAPEIDADNQIFASVSVTDKIIATTGAYERFFEVDGKNYHHVFDTSTGYPVDTDIISASVISEDGGLADFLSTQIFLSGIDNLDKYLNQDSFSCVVVDKDKNVYVSKKIIDDINIIDNEYELIQ